MLAPLQSLIGSNTHSRFNSRSGSIIPSQSNSRLGSRRGSMMPEQAGLLGRNSSVFGGLGQQPPKNSLMPSTNSSRKQSMMMPEMGDVSALGSNTVNFHINRSISELDTQVNQTTCLGDTDCWIQQVTAPTLVVTCWIQQSVCILPSTCTGGRSPPCPTRM